MNEKDLFNRVYKESGGIEPPQRLQPQSVEDALCGVKRKHRKANAVLACVLALVLVGSTVITAIQLNNRPVPYVTPPDAKVQNNSYEIIYNTVERVKKENARKTIDFQTYDSTLSNAMEGAGEGNGAISGNTAEDIGISEEKSNENNYSDTNLQVQGVQEADIVKTDGTYIYALDRQNLTIIKTDAGNMTFLSKTSIAVNSKDKDGSEYTATPEEMYISGNTLAVLCAKRPAQNGGYEPYYGDNLYDCAAVSDGTQIRLYDVTDKSLPKHLSTLSLSGGYMDSRMVADNLYVITNYMVAAQGAQKDEPETYVPVLENETKAYPINNGDICIAKAPLQQVQYTTVASVDLKNPSDFSAGKSVMGGGTNVYCNTENLYLAICDYSAGQEKLQLLKYALNDGAVTLMAEGSAQGSLINQFAMDEYNGYFRIVTQEREITEHTENGIASAKLGKIRQTLYVFDAAMQVAGRLENSSDDEFLQSVRFDKDYAYFVTFLQTDPLFTVDLTDPSNPHIVGELKIPGFSTYMHPFTENRLLGLGMDADESTGITTGLKLSMFDTADKTKVSEKHTLPFASAAANSSALYDHKAVLIDGEKNIIGIPVTEYGEYGYDAHLYYYIFAYDDEVGFVQKAKLLPQTAENLEASRGLYIDNYLYVVCAPVFTSYSLDSYKEIARLDAR